MWVTTDSGDELLTIAEVRAALKCGKNFPYELIQRGKLRAGRAVGRKWRVRRRDLEAYLEANRE